MEGFRLSGGDFWFRFCTATLARTICCSTASTFFFGPYGKLSGPERFMALYLLCGMFGAWPYHIEHWRIVANRGAGSVRLLFNDPEHRWWRIGGVSNILAVLLSNQMQGGASVFFLTHSRPWRTDWWLAASPFSRDGPNAGGEAGHLGEPWRGRIRRPHHLHGFFDFLAKWTHQRTLSVPSRQPRPRLLQPYEPTTKKWINFGQDQPERLAPADGKGKEILNRASRTRGGPLARSLTTHRATRDWAGSKPCTEGLIHPRLCPLAPVVRRLWPHQVEEISADHFEQCVSLDASAWRRGGCTSRRLPSVHALVRSHTDGLGGVPGVFHGTHQSTR